MFNPLYLEHFEKVDLFFAKTFSEDEEVFLFLAYLFKTARLGHLCSIIDDKLTPDSPFSEKIINGSKKVGREIVEEALHQVENRWYLKRNFECEQILLTHVARLKKGLPDRIALTACENLNEEQKWAVEKSLSSPLTFVCGGPGTGKTRTAVSIISHFPKKRVAVAAPTGKATANLRNSIKESENCTVATLQSLLKKKRQTYLPYDLIVVDEGSMIDAFLMTELFSAVFDESQLVILGDINQLPPVGVGNFFADLVMRESECVVFLKKCLRAELKEVLDLANRVNQKEIVPIFTLPKQKELVALLSEKLCLASSPPLEDLFVQYKRFRILTPQRVGPFGVESLNRRLYEENKKKGANYIPITIKANNSDTDLYNGDFGFLSEKEKMAYFEGGKKIPLSFLPPFEFGYLLSIHKSQGSEFDEVMVLLPEGSENFGKEMLYTAVTRAKRKITLLGALFGDSQILEKIYKNDGKRISGLQS